MFHVKYLTSLFLFWIKGEIWEERNLINFKTPNTVLGIIPLGSKKDSIPVTQISSTSTNFKLTLSRLLIAIFFILGSFGALSGENASFASFIIMILIGVGFLVDAFEIDLVVKTTSGETKLIDFLIFDKSTAEDVSTKINNLISGRIDDTNIRQQTDRVIDAINK